MKKQELLDEIYKIHELPNIYSYASGNYLELPRSPKQNLKKESKQFLENVLRILKHNKGVN